MWTYCQKTGELEHDGVVHGVGYSGHEEGKNDPAMQDRHGVGPIPCGQWKIEGPPLNTDTHGPFVLRLVPDPITNTFGRGGFLLHGDSKRAPGSASLGCIVMPRPTRERVWASGDRSLVVVSGVPAAPPAVA